MITVSANDLHPGVTLLTTLYDDKVLLLFRPVETWIEGDRKKESRGLQTCSVSAASLLSISSSGSHHQTNTRM